MNKELIKIIHTYGVLPQLKYFQSEVFELNEAILEHYHNEYIYYPEIDESLKKHIAEEIADVLVMLKQFQLYYDISDEQVKEIARYKIDRQIDRIEVEECKGQ